MNSIISIITSNKFKGLVSVAAAVVMYFTPDEIDHIIEGLLGAFGISALVINDKKK